MPGRREENAGKRMLKHLSAILEKSGVIIFEYHIKTDTLIRYNKELEVEVTVDENHINSIRFSNLDDTVTTMYPLIQPTMEEIADQSCQTQSLENISYSSDNPYTSQIIINAIDDALKKAVTTR